MENFVTLHIQLILVHAAKIQDAVLAEYHRLGELEVEFEEAGAS